MFESASKFPQVQCAPQSSRCRPRQGEICKYLKQLPGALVSSPKRTYISFHPGIPGDRPTVAEGPNPKFGGDFLFGGSSAKTYRHRKNR